MNTSESSFRGLANVSFFADDLDAARVWYTRVLGTEPYFIVDGYVEFRIGDHADELGIIDRRFAPGAGGPAGAVVSWHVDDLAATFDRLIALGAAVHDGIRERGHGFTTASVVDPFGNILAIMTNPNWVEHADRA
ncbi:VOC family protein [Demequina subtropica]|uniref:VOC family protein n=1 Tax=Demequina subtropica TaxID=1638989 RepID=UPI000785F788|nr:VOC family protein [Demequina subtropica]